MFHFTFGSVHLNEVIETLAVISTVATAWNSGYLFGVSNHKKDAIAVRLAIGVALTTIAIVILL